MDTAILIDGAFLRKKFHAAFKKDITAENVRLFADDLLEKCRFPKDSLHRAYFYDCEPCTAKTSTPVTNRAFLFEKTSQYANGMKLLSDIKKLDFFAVREGTLQFIAQKVIFVTGDSDFIPAIKTARRNGIFVYLVTLNHMVRTELPDNCDVCLKDGIKSFNCL